MLKKLSRKAKKIVKAKQCRSPFNLAFFSKIEIFSKNLLGHPVPSNNYQWLNTPPKKATIGRLPIIECTNTKI